MLGCRTQNSYISWKITLSRVVITQRGHGPVMLRRTVFLIVSVRPIQLLSTKPVSPFAVSITIFGPKSPLSKRPCRCNLSQAIKRGSSQNVDRGRIEERTLR